MKGFFGFLTVFVILLLIMLVSVSENNFYGKLGEATIFMVEAEQASKERTIMENNVDKIVHKKLYEQVLKRNFKIDSILENINSELENYFLDKSKATNINTNIGNPTKSFLNSNSTAFMIEKKGIIYAEYVFTGGMFKTNSVSKDFGKNITTTFRIPADYTVRVTG